MTKMTKINATVATSSTLTVPLAQPASRTVQRLGFGRPTLDEASLIETAHEETGLEDFGPDRFRSGLRTLIESLEHESHLNPLGRAAARREFIALLANRLRVLDHRKRHPGVAAEEIRRPLFVIGMARTATTLLFGLLAQDPAHRSPLTWEVAMPCPPPETATYYSDPRIEEAERRFKAMKRARPGCDAIHPGAARLPQECLMIHAMNFHSIAVRSNVQRPVVRALARASGHAADLSLSARFPSAPAVALRGGTIGAQSPAHLIALDALLEVFPDAIIVQTRRDPLEVIGSAASLHLHAACGLVRRHQTRTPWGETNSTSGRVFWTVQSRSGTAAPIKRASSSTSNTRTCSRIRWDASGASTRTLGWISRKRRRHE